MDGIHDVGGMQGFGHVPELADAPPFDEPWEGKAFVIGALAARISGTNLHAFRHAIERVPPSEYLVGYWNRWTIGAQTMMQDSGIVTDAEVRARAASAPMTNAWPSHGSANGGASVSGWT